MSITEFLSQYGFFVVQVLTVILLIVAVVGLVLIVTRRGEHEPGGIVIEKLNDRLAETKAAVNSVLLDKKAQKQAKKERKQSAREAKSASSSEPKPRMFVLDFKGDLRASGTASLREEITAILSVASPDDTVVLRLENAGGAVHEHGLAASQLLRLKANGLKLTVIVDKVAASGGYLMACVADHIIAAPFAIIGSIGVLAQLPNFHRLLESKGIDYEQITAGRFKRTLTMFGQNTDEAREKMKTELEEVHDLFKAQIVEHREQIDIERVATGEHWYGLQAIELKLIDEIRTSDDYLRDRIEVANVYRVQFKRKKSLPERFMSTADAILSH